MDIVRPDRLPADPMPALVLLHGGAWCMGSREDRANQVVAERLAREGFFTISPDYRLSQEAIFPAQIHDVRTAVRWLRAHASEHRVDPARIGALGYSAGGHLAALLGTSARSSFGHESQWEGHPSDVRAVACFSSPTDFLASHATHNRPDTPEAQLVGGPVHDRVELAQLANPISHINGSVPPFLIVHGEHDALVPVEQSRLLHEALTRSDPASSTYLPIPSGTHDFWELWANVEDQVVNFLKQHLGTKSQ